MATIKAWEQVEAVLEEAEEVEDTGIGKASEGIVRSRRLGCTYTLAFGRGGKADFLCQLYHNAFDYGKSSVASTQYESFCPGKMAS